MKKLTYFTPGPSELYFTVQDHMKQAMKSGIASISHRSREFELLFEETSQHLKQLFQVEESHELVFTSSATEIWYNILKSGNFDSSTHYANGAFSEKFHQVAESLGLDTELNAYDWGQGPNKNQVTNHNQHIALTHNETSTGWALKDDFIKEVRKENPKSIISLDVVSSAPVYSLPYREVDTFYFSVQKAFGLPAGLGVWFYNDRLLERAKSNSNTYKGYHSLLDLDKMRQKSQTVETPAVLNIYLLNEVTKDLLRKGKEAIWRETQYKSSLLYHSLDEIQGIEPFVKDLGNRSKTVAVFECNKAEEVINEVAKLGFILGSGYGDLAKKQIRIANFPTHSKEHVELLVDTIGNVLKN